MGGRLNFLGGKCVVGALCGAFLYSFIHSSIHSSLHPWSAGPELLRKAKWIEVVPGKDRANRGAARRAVRPLQVQESRLPARCPCWLLQGGGRFGAVLLALLHALPDRWAWLACEWGLEKVGAVGGFPALE